MNDLRFFSRVGILTGLILVLVCCTQAASPQISTTPTIDGARLTASAQPSPTEIPIPTPITASAANVGPAPTDCPLDPPLRPQKLSDNIVPLGGTSPVWATVAGSGPGHLAGDTWSPDGGWPVKIVWEVGPNYNHPVMLRAGNLRDGTLLKWHMSPDGHLTTAPVLDPQHPGHPVSAIGPEWNEWGSDILIPAAGCYYVEAIWPEGQWRATFAIGL